MLSKLKENIAREFATACFDSTAKMIMDSNKYGLNKSFQVFIKLLYRIDNWINKGSAWIIEYGIGKYMNISIYNPLTGSFYIKLPEKLTNPKKDWLISKAMTIYAFFGIMLVM